MVVNKHFWNKKIDVFEYEKHKDENGATIKGYNKILSNVSCNIQPYSSDKAKTTYGYNCECTNRVFYDVDTNIKESSIIEWNGNTYKVTAKPLKWDSYKILFIQEYEVDING